MSEAAEQELQDESIEQETEQEDEQLAENQGAEQGEQGNAQDDDGEKVVFDAKQQEKLNAILNRKFGHTKELEEKLQATERELQEVRSKLPQEKAPEVPDYPDANDPDYKEKLKARDDALQKRAAFDAQERARSERELELQKQQREQQEQQAMEVLTSYVDRAKKLQIDEPTLQKAGQFMGMAGIPQPVIGHIVQKEIGPQMAVYLMNNPAEADKLANMMPLAAAEYIATSLEPAAKKSIKKVDAGDPPPKHLKGGGAPEGGRGPKGTTFE